MQATIDTMFVNEKDSFCQFSQDKYICGKNQSLPPWPPKIPHCGGGEYKKMYFDGTNVVFYIPQNH